MHALDGAWLLFQPATGLSIRVETDATAGVRRQAPRVVLFSLSHACNLVCGFCSRDAQQHARWSTDAAFDTLVALWQAGTLEVSFGGGEPLVHAGFVALLERLHRETTLALHFTTNGTRVTPALAARLAAVVGEVRLSAYDGEDWDSALRTLTTAGCRVGVNVMPTPETLGALPGILARAHTAGARDVAVLRYVGEDPSLQLSSTDFAHLEQAIVGAPLQVRVSNCLLAQMPNVPRLTPGLTVAGEDGLFQDCGAGRDFVVIEPDAAVRSCSFHRDAVPLGDVSTWLEAFRRPRPASPSPRRGCARPVFVRRSSRRGAFVYRAFASNNSGDTLLVARFEAVRDANAFVASLPGAPAFESFDDAAWKAFYEAHGEGGVPNMSPGTAAPETLVQVGPSVLATGYGLGEELVELQRILWAAGATTVYRAEHTHDDPAVVVAIDDPDRQWDRELPGYGLTPARRGAVLLAHGTSSDWVELLQFLGEDLGSRRWAAELLENRPAQRWADVLKHLDEQGWSTEGYLCVCTGDANAAKRLAATLDGEVSVVGDTVLCSVHRFRPRLGRQMSRFGGAAWWIPKMPLAIRMWAWLHPERVSPTELAELQALAGEGVQLIAGRAGFSAKVRTEAPHEAMTSLQRVFLAYRSTRPNARGGAWIGPAEPLLATTRRVQHTLKVLR